MVHGTPGAPLCGATWSGTVVSCQLDLWHPGPHAATVHWTVDARLEHDDAPTQKLPPITDTVRRRPPPVPLRELKGAELLQALLDSIEADPETTGEDL